MLEGALEVAGESPADCLDEGFEVGLFAEGGGGVVLERHFIMLICAWRPILLYERKE